jgi:hypothetical protein
MSAPAAVLFFSALDVFHEIVRAILLRSEQI